MAISKPGHVQRLIAVVLLLRCTGVCFAVQGDATDSDVDERLDVLYGEHRIYREFLDSLKKAVLARDKNTVSKLMSYPLRVTNQNKTFIVKSPKDFVARYGQIINDNVYQAVKSQQYRNLFANSRGLMIGRGQVWFSGICVEKTQAHPCSKTAVKVISFNLDAPR